MSDSVPSAPPVAFRALPLGRPILLWPSDKPGLCFAFGRTVRLVKAEPWFGINGRWAIPGGNPDVLEPRDDRFFCANVDPGMLPDPE